MGNSDLSSGVGAGKEKTMNGRALWRGLLLTAAVVFLAVAMWASLGMRAPAAEAAVEESTADAAMRELTAADCFGDTTYMVGSGGTIYISPSSPSFYQGPYTYLGIRASRLQFTHDFTGSSVINDVVWAGIVTDDYMFVGFPIYEEAGYMKAFTAGGDETRFKNGVIGTRAALPGTGVYTIDVTVEGNDLTIRTGDQVLYELTVNNGVTIRGIGILRYNVSYANRLYDCRIVPMPAQEEQDAGGRAYSSIAADYFLKGNAPKAEKTKKLCIIGAGQSNIDGYVPVADLPEDYSLPMSGMKYIKNALNGYFTDGYPSVDLWSFDVVLCKYLIDNLGEDNLYYIKWTEGNTSIDPSCAAKSHHWTADYEQLPDLSDSLLYSFETEIRKCEENNPGEYEIRAMIWHQGEGDAARESLMAPANYYSNMKKVIAYCRGVVGNANLPFVFGTVAHASDNYDPVIEAAMRRIAEEDPYVWLVDMSNAELIDQWHFNAAWSEYLGMKYYDCLIDAGVIEGTKLNPSEPTAEN